MIKERVTVDFDSESYYLDGEYWESWDNYGEEMAEKINELLNKQDKTIKEKENLIRAKNQQLEDVKRILTNHKKVISYMEVGQCTTARLELIEQILNELGWD